MFEASHLQHNIVSGYIQIVSGGHTLPAFWSHPDEGGTFPGLVMLHDGWGLTPSIRSQARRFAEQGYYVVAPDLFNRQVAESPVQTQALIAQAGEVALAQVNVALRALRTHHKCNAKIGLIGWGWGGQLALQAAVFHDDLRALVVFYRLPDDLPPAELRLVSGPLLAIFGAQDPASPPEAVERLRQALAGAGIAGQVIAYPDAGHDFFDDSRPAFVPGAAHDAWKNVLKFLNEHLEVPPRAAPGPSQSDPGDTA